MKIAYIITEDFVFLSHRFNLANEVKKQGNEVYVIASDNGHAQKIKEMGFNFIESPISRAGMNPLRDAVSILKLIKILRDVKPSVVHNVAIKPVIYGTYAAIFSGCKTIVNAITGLGYVYIETEKTKILRMFVSFLYKIALSFKRVKIIFQNPDDLDLFSKLGIVKKEKAVIIYGSGVNVEKFKKTSTRESDVVKVTLPSRMLIDKGVVELIEAAKIVYRKSSRKFIIELAGTSDPSNPNSISERDLINWNKLEFVDWIGWQSDMVKIFNDTDIACLPSYREGLPKALIEAASMSLPIISTDAPGCKEICLDNYNGFQVPVKSIDTLAEQLQKLIEDDDLRRKMGENSRTLVINKLSSEIVNKETIALYN